MSGHGVKSATWRSGCILNVSPACRGLDGRKFAKASPWGDGREFQWLRCCRSTMMRMRAARRLGGSAARIIAVERAGEPQGGLVHQHQHLPKAVRKYLDGTSLCFYLLTAVKYSTHSKTKCYKCTDCLSTVQASARSTFFPSFTCPTISE